MLGYQEGRDMLTPRASRGFTLIEAMIAIVLLSILLLLGLPSFMTMLSNLRVRSVSDGVLSGIQVARTEALKRNLNITFQLDPLTGVGGGWRVYPTNDTTNILQSKSTNAGGAVLVAMAAGATELEFNNLGRRILPVVTNGTGTLDIDVSNPGYGACEASSGPVRCLRITVSIGGETRLCDPNRTTGDPQAC
jgi:type IV fimbrial biogenesis protein FimT